MVTASGGVYGPATENKKRPVGKRTSFISQRGIIHPSPYSAARCRARLEKDLAEPTNEENQAYKSADPISEVHYGHRTEDATAFSHDFFSGMMRLSRADDQIKPKKPAEPLKIFRLLFF